MPVVDRLARVSRLERTRPPFPWNIAFANWPLEAVARVNNPHVIADLTDGQLIHIMSDTELAAELHQVEEQLLADPETPEQLRAKIHSERGKHNAPTE
jgi:hypothetical protein